MCSTEGQTISRTCSRKNLEKSHQNREKLLKNHKNLKKKILIFFEIPKISSTFFEVVCPWCSTSTPQR